MSNVSFKKYISKTTPITTKNFEPTDAVQFNDKLVLVGSGMAWEPKLQRDSNNYIMQVWDYTKEKKLEGLTYILECPDPFSEVYHDSDSEEDAECGLDQYDVMHLTKYMRAVACIWKNHLVVANILGSRVVIQLFDENFESQKCVAMDRCFMGLNLKHFHSIGVWGEDLVLAFKEVYLWNFNKPDERKPKKLKTSDGSDSEADQDEEVQGLHEEEDPSPLRVFHNKTFYDNSVGKSAVCVYRDLLWTADDYADRIIAWRPTDTDTPRFLLSTSAVDMLVWNDHLIVLQGSDVYKKIDSNVKVYFVSKQDPKKIYEMPTFSTKMMALRIAVWQNKLVVIGATQIKVFNWGNFECLWQDNHKMDLNGGFCLWKGKLWLTGKNGFAAYEVSLPWLYQRLFWIAKIKNQPEECPMAKLPKEVLGHIVSYLHGNALQVMQKEMPLSITNKGQSKPRNPGAS